VGRIYRVYATNILYNILRLLNTLNYKKIKKIVYALHIYKAQWGHKLSVVREVVTPFNFVTPLSFSVTPPSYKPLTDDGITIAAAGPIRCPLLNSYCRRLDPTR
jgi:hypothetical protein